MYSIATEVLVTCLLEMYGNRGSLVFDTISVLCAPCCVMKSNNPLAGVLNNKGHPSGNVRKVLQVVEYPCYTLDFLALLSSPYSNPINNFAREQYI